MATISHSQRVAANVRAELARRGIPRSALAQQLGLSTSALSRRLDCRVPFSIDEVWDAGAAIALLSGDEGFTPISLVGEAVAA